MVSERTFSVYVAKPYYTLFQTEAAGTFQMQDGGTLVVGRTGLNRLVLLVSAALMAVLVVAAAVVAAVLVVSPAGSTLASPATLIVLIVFVAFLAGLFSLGRVSARGEDVLLVGLLREILEVEEVVD